MPLAKQNLLVVNVACKTCDSLYDSTFCRDLELIPDGFRPPKWTCRGCDGEYDQAAIEIELVGMVGIIEKSFA